MGGVLGCSLGGRLGDCLGRLEAINHRWGRPEAAPTDDLWGGGRRPPPQTDPKSYPQTVSQTPPPNCTPERTPDHPHRPLNHPTIILTLLRLASCLPLGSYWGPFGVWGRGGTVWGGGGTVSASLVIATLSGVNSASCGLTRLVSNSCRNSTTISKPLGKPVPDYLRPWLAHASETLSGVHDGPLRRK